MAQKYGAMFILLPLSDAGLPESLQEKKEIIETILERPLHAAWLKKISLWTVWSLLWSQSQSGSGNAGNHPLL